MARTTFFLFFLLAILAAFLFGVAWGKKMASNPLAPVPLLFPSLYPSLSPSPFFSPSPLPSPTLTSASPSAQIQGLSLFEDKTCGFSFSLPSSFLQVKTTHQNSTILTDPENPEKSLAFACEEKIPRPPVSEKGQKEITLGGRPASLYLVPDEKGEQRIVVIAKHPEKNWEIVLAGYEPLFSQVLASFRFL